MVMNKISRTSDLVNFKDIYLVHDQGQMSLEILQYQVFLLSLEQVAAILNRCGFRVETVYSNLATLDTFGKESTDMTFLAVKR